MVPTAYDRMGRSHHNIGIRHGRERAIKYLIPSSLSSPVFEIYIALSKSSS